MESTTDKRKLQRIEFPRPVDLEFIAQQSDHTKNIRKEGKGIDVSSGGLGLSTSYSLSKGQIVKLTIPVKGRDIRIPLFSEVVWVIESKGEFRVGFQFLS